MSSPKDKPSKSRSRITKAELEEQLAAKNAVIKEQKAELTRYQEKLETLESQLKEGQKKDRVRANCLWNSQFLPKGQQACRKD